MDCLRRCLPRRPVWSALSRSGHACRRTATTTRRTPASIVFSQSAMRPIVARAEQRSARAERSGDHATMSYGSSKPHDGRIAGMWFAGPASTPHAECGTCASLSQDPTQVDAAPCGCGGTASAGDETAGRTPASQTIRARGLSVNPDIASREKPVIPASRSPPIWRSRDSVELSRARPGRGEGAVPARDVLNPYYAGRCCCRVLAMLLALILYPAVRR